MPLRLTLAWMLSVRLWNTPSVPSAASDRRLKRRAKPEPAELAPSVANSFFNSPRLPSALSSLLSLVSSVPSDFNARPMSDSRDQVADALLPSFSTARIWLCSASVAWSPCSAPLVLLSAL